MLGVFLFAGISGCAGTPPPPPPGDEARIGYLRAFFEQEEYYAAIQGLQQFLADRPGSRFVEEATFLIGRAYYEEGLYIEAEEQFRRVLLEFPGGDVACEAAYYLGLSLLSQSRPAPLDQTETRVALAQFRAFVNRYPDHALADRARTHIKNIRNKLAEKAYLNGRTYEKRGFHYPARFYFEERVLKDYGDTKWAIPAMEALSRSYARTKEWEDATRWAQKIVDTDPEHEAAGEARKILKEARDNGVEPGDTGSASPAVSNEPE